MHWWNFKLSGVTGPQSRGSGGEREASNETRGTVRRLGSWRGLEGPAKILEVHDLMCLPSFPPRQEPRCPMTRPMLQITKPRIRNLRRLSLQAAQRMLSSHCSQTGLIRLC